MYIGRLDSRIEFFHRGTMKPFQPDERTENGYRWNWDTLFDTGIDVALSLEKECFVGAVSLPLMEGAGILAVQVLADGKPAGLLDMSHAPVYLGNAALLTGELLIPLGVMAQNIVLRITADMSPVAFDEPEVLGACQDDHPFIWPVPAQYTAAQEEPVAIGSVQSDDSEHAAFAARELTSRLKERCVPIDASQGVPVHVCLDQSFDEERYRRFDGDFWELDRERFPQGMEAVAEYAAQKGVKLGLWFAPDPHDNFAHLARDIAVLKKAYEEWNIRYFKLDMFYVRNRTEQAQMVALLQAIHRFGEGVAVEMDVTRPYRLNYYFAAEYGKVFAENRYTKRGNFFPHRTLRNFWGLARYLPAGRLQFELVNPDLNREQYEEQDILAPANYELDYLFASVMLGNPLFWMETQFLSKARKEELQRILPIWKAHRAVLAGADIVPVGDRPNGKSITGFLVRKDRKNRYLLVFRESTEATAAVIPMQVMPKELTLLASNHAAKAELLPGAAKVSFSNPRTYAFYKIED